MKKKLLVAIIALMFSVTAIGCGSNTVSNNATVSENVSDNASKLTQDQVLFSVEGYDVTAREFNQYLIQSLSCYQVQSPQMSDELKNQFITETKDEIRLELIIEKLAVDSGITLSDAIKQKIDENVNMFTTYYGDTILKVYGIEEDLVRAYFTRVATVSTYEKTEEEKYKTQYIEQIKGELSATQFCSFSVFTFDSEDNAKKFKSAMDKGKTYQDMVSELENYPGSEVKDDKGIYGGFDDSVNTAIDGLSNGELSDVITYEGKPAVVLMRNSVDEDFYMQTVNYIASETAKQLYAESIDKYIKENNIPEVSIDDSLLKCIDPQLVYTMLMDVEQLKQQQQQQQ